MRFGRFPARDEAIRRRIQELKRQRRWFLGAAIVSFGMGLAGGFLAGRSGAADAPVSGRVAWARELAMGPLRELATSYAAYCVVAETAWTDELVQVGIQRLGWAVVERPQTLRGWRLDPGKVARRLLRVVEGLGGFESHAALLQALRERARGR